MLANRVNGCREQVEPTNDCKEHYLFLLEFFVKRASGDRLARLNQMFFVPTTVYFGFLDFVDDDDLTLTAADRSRTDIADDVQIFNAGKSVLFSVDSSAVADRAARMILNVTVKKEMPDGIKPDVSIGIGELDLSKQYAALRMETLQCWRQGDVTSKTIDGRVPLIRK